MRDDAAERMAPRAAQCETIPWADGALLRYLTGEAVLDIKAPNDPDRAPVIPGASLALTRCPCSAIFSRDALMFAADPLATLAAWFGRLSEHGHLVLVLPLSPNSPASGLWSEARPEPGFAAPQAEALLVPPALAATPLGVTPENLLRAVHAALPEGSFEIVELGSAPARRPGAMEEDIRLVLRKCASPAALPVIEARKPAIAPAADAVIPFMRLRPSASRTPGLREESGLLVRDFAPRAGPIRRILVLKLDHHGDFIIGLPALRELRLSFPAAHIRLICGRWNLAAARASGLVDDIRVFDYFPERAAEWSGPARTQWHLFAEAAAGHFDLAIDLRVDEDTRALLGRVDAALRCGIGSQSRFPMLDIALPDASRQPVRLPHSPLAPVEFTRDGAQLLAPDSFYSEMEHKTATYHETQLTQPGHLLLSSGELNLPKGHYALSFQLSSHGFVPGYRGAGIRLEVAANGQETIAAREFGRGGMWRLNEQTATLRFQSEGDPIFYEFRLRTLGRPLAGRLRFHGALLRRLDCDGARFSPSELHVGEKLSLLIHLIAQRTQPRGLAEAAPPPRGRLNIIIAPFSNSTIRDWGQVEYAGLITRLAAELDCGIELIGSPSQMSQAAALTARLPPGLVQDRVGRTQWSEMPGILSGADLVICNNSGIAHQAAQLGVRTLAIYSASHQPTEWGPRGPNARAIMMGVACSPCGFERIEDCSHDHLCMKLITPEAVMGQVRQMLAGP